MMVHRHGVQLFVSEYNKLSAPGVAHSNLANATRLRSLAVARPSIEQLQHEILHTVNSFDAMLASGKTASDDDLRDFLQQSRVAVYKIRAILSGLGFSISF